MVIENECSYCGRNMRPGTGMKYIKNDGTAFWFCSKRCRLSQLKFKRDPRKYKWTKKYVKGSS